MKLPNYYIELTLAAVSKDEQARPVYVNTGFVCGVAPNLPDTSETMVSLVGGGTYRVRESVEEVLRLIRELSIVSTYSS